MFGLLRTIGQMLTFYDMKSLVTTSTSRSNLRLQTWGIYLPQFWGRISVLYSKGSKIDCPDALSRLRYDLSERSSALREWASRLGKEQDTAKFEVTEAFAVTRSSTRSQAWSLEVDTIPMQQTTRSDTPRPLEKSLVENSTLDNTSNQTEQRATLQGIAIAPSEACKKELRQVVQDSAHFSAIYKRLQDSDKTIVDGSNHHELPETCQYILCDGLLYLNDPITQNMRLVLANQELQKRQLMAAHTDAHHGYATMHEAMRLYYWKRMPQSIRAFLRHCPHCLRNKPANHKPFGLLSPIPAPDEPFDTWSIDLITDLPPCVMKNMTITYDTIMTVTDKFSKAVRFLL
jgi:hypothetical protein